jgi:ABC-type uncharacterized transport system permease subunit
MMASGVEWVYVAGALFIIGLCILDVWLVETGRTSISLSVWLIERAHPTVVVGMVFLGIWLAGTIYFYLPVAYETFALLFFLVLAVGHLVTTEGAAAAMTKRSNWLEHR